MLLPLSSVSLISTSADTAFFELDCAHDTLARFAATASAAATLRSGRLQFIRHSEEHVTFLITLFTGYHTFTQTSVLCSALLDAV